jgi:hypothetical protein
MRASPQPDAAVATRTSAATLATIGGDLTNALAAADGTTSQQLQNLGLVHQARVAQLTRTAANVAARYGAGSAQAVAAQAKVSAGQATVTRIAVVTQQAGIAAPQVAANGWALYGHVYNAQLQPVSAYCVFLVDAQNAYQSAYGFNYTDATGSFVINFAGAAASASEPGQRPRARSTAPPRSTPQLFVEIANNSGQPVYLSKTAFQPVLGAATYQNITLPAGEPPIGEPPIGDPPSVLRAIALPPPPKSG